MAFRLEYWDQKGKWDRCKPGLEAVDTAVLLKLALTVIRFFPSTTWKSTRVLINATIECILAETEYETNTGCDESIFAANLGSNSPPEERLGCY